MPTVRAAASLQAAASAPLADAVPDYYVVVSGPHDTATARVLELSAADGRLVRVLRTQTARVPAGADISDAIGLRCGVLSVASGGQVLAQAFAFGRIDSGAFTSLPGTSPDGAPVSAAW